ncbi:lipid A export permease/ATP-binding protein MsbA [Gammaproteobacteria bacterium]|nr:lipid A export permease/ATP-binding protein MsbA [Gammaproteobacteria bacterium]MDB9901320.1 lipid A export permease/ATP-binding protein MsbA [Gammaproteobacteria bacterium]MDC0123077.1 lipid A export permease/ATP-binding protein MsbA [Gammaproteobacteria bacterium]MDC1469202.1 lipid A export permease/ATP-binding protein MsbA [Gammaproteobacteria bacterium]
MSPLRRLFSYTFRFKFSFFVSIIGFLMFAAADIAAVEWIRRIIEFINSDKTDFSIYLVLALIFIALGRGIGFFIGNYFMSRVGFGIVHDLRSELFTKLINLPKMYFDQNQSGQLINRITFTTTQVSGAASNAIKTFVREGFLLIGLMIYMLSLNWKLTLLLLITTPFIALIVYVAGKRLRKLAKTIQTAMGDVTHLASEAVDGNLEIKSFNAESYETERFLKANASNKNQNLKLEATSNLATPIIQLLVSVSLSIVAYFALGAQLGIELSAENFVAFITAAGLMAKPIRQLSNINAVIQKGLAAAIEIFDQLDSKEEEDSGDIESAITGNIEFNDVTFSYTPKELVLNSLNFSIAQNETVAIVGKSGSGKSTIANLLSRFYSDFTGDISIDGVSIKDYKLSFLRESISIVNQSPTLFNDTIERNIAYGETDIDEDKLKQAAEISGCLEFIEKLPEGYKSEIGDDGVLLSGGQRQRIAIARAFYKNSPIIILDEATSALDNESELIVQEAVEKLINNRTTIVIAHRLSTIENANKILVLDQGTVAEFGTHQDLLEQEGIYKSLYQNKFSDGEASSTHSTKSKSQEYLPSFTEEPAQQGYLIDAWYNKSFWLYLLSPFTFIFSAAVRWRKSSYAKNPSKVWNSDVPIVVVGNITMGGTGKTPLVKHIASELKERGYKPGLVSRGYGGKFSGTLEVNKETTFKQTGDEAQLLSKLQIPFFIDKDRSRAAQTLQEKYDCDVIISDDGLQHYKMDRKVEIAVIDGARRLGNGMAFPAGPLREPKGRLKEVDFIVNNGGPTEADEILMTLNPAKFVHLNSGKRYSVENWPMHKQVHAVAGVGNPNRFFDLLSRLGFEFDKSPFPDHHKYNKRDLYFLDHLPILMTEKDAAKCKHFNNSKIWYLSIEAKIESQFIDRLEEKIND